MLRHLCSFLGGFLVLTSLLCSGSSASIELDHVDGSTVYFKGNDAPKPLKTTFFDLGFLGSLQDENAPQYFVFRGRPCEKCLEETQIYAFKVTNQNGMGKPTAFVYPGRIVDPKHHQTVYESRAFIGRCLNHDLDSLVIFQRERVDRHGLMSSVYVAEPAADHLHERLIERKAPRIETTLRLVRAKVCHEIEGKNRMMLSKPLDLKPHRDHDSDEEEDDSDEGDDAPNAVSDLHT